jgi:hypothetical protein
MTLNPGLSSSAPALQWQSARRWRSVVVLVVMFVAFATLFSVILESRLGTRGGSARFFATYGVPLGILIGLTGPVGLVLNLRKLYAPRIALASSLRAARPTAVVVTLRETVPGVAAFREFGAIPAHPIRSLKAAPPPPSVLVVERGRLSFWWGTSAAPVNALDISSAHISYLRLRDDAIASGSQVKPSRANSSWVFVGIQTSTAAVVELPLSISREGIDAPWPLTGSDLRDCVATLTSVLRG